MKKLTKKKALEICADLWGWLEKHPNKRKGYWPGWETNGGQIPAMKDKCPCCQYGANKEGTNRCDICPLKSFWDTSKGSSAWLCMYSSSQYFKWDSTLAPKTRKKYAKMIKDECLRRLK